PASPLLPYTTLFRSCHAERDFCRLTGVDGLREFEHPLVPLLGAAVGQQKNAGIGGGRTCRDQHNREQGKGKVSESEHVASSHVSPASFIPRTSYFVLETSHVLPSVRERHDAAAARARITRDDR